MATTVQITPKSSVSLRHERDGRRHVFVVCNGECCRKAGASQLVRLLKDHIQKHAHEQDVCVSVSRECIGHCAAAPAMVEDGQILRWVSLRRLKSELLRLGLS